MWITTLHADFCSQTVTIPSLESELHVAKEVLGGLKAAILYVTARRQSLAIQPPLYPRKWADSVNTYKLAINDLVKWLKGKAAPTMATVEGGDKGWYQIPEVLKGTGSEVYALNAARHCEHFPMSRNGRRFSESDGTMIACRLWLGLEQMNWPMQRTIPQELYKWLSTQMNRIARHEFKPTRHSRAPGTERVRGRDGLIRWSSFKWKLLNCIPRWMRQYENAIRNDDVLLYVILTSTEARWLVWWPINAERTTPYAIRATQSHKGGDLDLSLLYKEITIGNFHETFGKGSRWFHCTNMYAAICIAEYGLAPGGNERLMARTGDLWNTRPIRLASNSTGEWQMKDYPGANIQFTFDPLVLLRIDECRQQQIKESGNLREIHWCGFYLSTTGNILSWTPVLFARNCIDKVAHLKYVPKFHEDQPGRRVSQRSVVEPRSFDEFMQCSTVYYDVTRAKLGENEEAFAKFRELEEPIVQKPSCGEKTYGDSGKSQNWQKIWTPLTRKPSKRHWKKLKRRTNCTSQGKNTQQQW